MELTTINVNDNDVNIQCTIPITSFIRNIGSIGFFFSIMGPFYMTLNTTKNFVVSSWIICSMPHGLSFCFPITISICNFARTLQTIINLNSHFTIIRGIISLQKIKNDFPICWQASKLHLWSFFHFPNE